MDVQTIPLAAGTRTRLTIPGRFFMLIESGAPVDVSFEHRLRTLGEQARQVEAGYARFPGDWADRNAGIFDAVILESATNQSVRIGISQEAADYRRTVGVFQLQQANDGATEADQAVVLGSTLIAAANSSRRKIVVQNTGANNIRVSLTNPAAAATGQQLQPGMSTVFHTTSAVYAIREGGADSTVSVTEETRT